MAHLNLEQEDERGIRKPIRVSLPGSPFRFTTNKGNMYSLGSIIGRGGNGTVFRCHPKAGLAKAVKFLHVFSTRHTLRFDFEHKVLTAFDHKNILRIEDSGSLNNLRPDIADVPYIVTPAFNGNLEDEVKRLGPLPLNRVKSLAVDMCDAFTYAHSKGVIHRDIKPGNLFLTSSSVVVGDFGLAKTTEDEGQTRFLRPKITADSERVGPVEYMSPELVKYSADETKMYPVDERSDIFQIGAVIWFMLTGAAPRGVAEEDDDPSGGKMFPIVAKCLRLKPEKRFQAVSELSADLSALTV